MHKLVPRRRTVRPRTVARLLLCFGFFSVSSASCRTVVVADCPKPSPIEAQDLSEWLLEDPDRPAKDWVSRAIGQMYPDELEEVRSGD